MSASLFRDPPPVSADASGLHRIEAPGPLGEARLVARRVRQLLDAGTPPHAIVVTARRFDRFLPLLREVFAEYTVPHAGPAPDPLSADPVVRTLLAAWSLPDAQFPFAPTAALLRSTFFRPVWPDVRDDPDLPTRAESLLRQLGQPRGKDAYLRAVRMWAESPPLPLEDEGAEEPKRKRLGRLAVRCRPFLERFFGLWDNIPKSALPRTFADRLRKFADALGLPPVPAFWAELDRWTADSRGRIDAAGFARAIGILTAYTPRPTTETGDTVRIRTAEEACLLASDHLFVVGLEEGSFPRLTGSNDDLSAEMLLFARLVSRPRRSLTLSRPAVDAKGQPLLPSSFLTAVAACFTEIPTTAARMPIEGYAVGPSFAEAERRVQAARAADPDGFGLSADVVDNLRSARLAVARRSGIRDFAEYDGRLRHPPVLAHLHERFGPERVFSPTALEAYVACPFRFWLEHVLRLEPLDDPAEEVEQTRRGAAVHRALARFHNRVKDRPPTDELSPELDSELVVDVRAAVAEYAERAPSRPAAVLWTLEGERLLRSIRRYRTHWQGFRTPWRADGALPFPHALEADFGMPPEDDKPIPDPLTLALGDLTVKVGGRIDRVDVAELADGIGFWIIDYKTGRGENYTPADIQRMQALQLPLYAVAVERVLLAGKNARPLGLGYWLVTEEGHKPALPAGRGKDAARAWLSDPAAWAKFREQLLQWVAAIVGDLRSGEFPLAPRSEHCTDKCGFGPVCRIAQARAVGKGVGRPLPVVG